MQKANRLFLVGIGYRPLSAKAHAVVTNAAMLLASTRLLEVFRRYAEYESVRDRIRVIDGIPEMIACIATELTVPRPDGRTIVLLASGDPLFFGIGRRMIDEFGAEGVEIIPDLSSVQEAFARIGIPWDDAFCISVHGGPDIAKRRALPSEVSDIPWLLRRYPKIAVLTDRQQNPAVIARELKTVSADQGDGISVFVSERLGYPDERTWAGTLSEAAERTFAEPNVMILLGHAETSAEEVPVFGLAENELCHRNGMITKDEIRAVAIHKLRLPAKGLLWDIGAGSGSVAIEAARIAPGLAVAAVEHDEEQAARIRANKMTFDVRNLRVVMGTAPEALADLGAPDRVFIGGSGGRLAAILKAASSAMASGIIVINAASLETLQEGIAVLERLGFSTEVSEISVSRSHNVAGRKMMRSINPVFIVKGERGS